MKCETFEKQNKKKTLDIIEVKKLINLVEKHDFENNTTFYYSFLVYCT